jgi:hypothetical protein
MIMGELTGKSCLYKKILAGSIIYSKCNYGMEFHVIKYNILTTNHVIKNKSFCQDERSNKWKTLT